jgi:hypothetical protein
MTPDDAHTSHNHGFELPNAPQVVVRGDPRPWRAVAGVAVCLGLAGMITGLIVARRQSASDEHLTSDALQREELRDGWKALGAAAAYDARANELPAPAAQPSATVATAAPAPSPNVVIVNLPAQPQPTQPANPAPSTVTNINLPTSADPRASGAVMDGSSSNPGLVPIQSLPPLNYSPVPGYVPTQTGYPSAPMPNAPSVGNGSIPGAAANNPGLPNQAQPNTGLVGPTTLPSLPNATTNSGANPSAPAGPAPVSPNTPTLPSGFSAP